MYLSTSSFKSGLLLSAIAILSVGTAETNALPANDRILAKRAGGASLPQIQPPQGRKLCYDKSQTITFDSAADLNNFSIQMSPNSFSVQNGVLNIVQDRDPSKQNPTIHFNEFKGEGGVWDVNLKAAPTSGVVTAFVMYGSGAPGSTDEVDFEWVGKNTNNVQSMFFVNGQRVPGSEREVTFGSNPPQDLATTFHTYSIEYNKDYVNWYLDGAVKRTITNNNNGQFPATLGKLALGVWDGSNTSGWAGTVDYSLAPFVAQIDTIRFTPYC
ncbi:hypothetical protein H4219_002822 [Mycoemilia scoparia]|uniref:GH16 domain-containing protein n=1 Tax=Mycoemilia scoparia TaxID=417184 RepID=A0A9W8DNN0_9FUNG|nr:hypothetical protein H4219_002822 [Mycoemilia scoparia]